MLNKAFILKLADHMETTTDTYDQRGWTTCIASHACTITGVDVVHPGDKAKHLLGLDVEQYTQLFSGCPLPHAGFASPPKATAARVLRHLAATGNVDWKVKEAKLPTTLTDALKAEKPAPKAKRALADA